MSRRSSLQISKLAGSRPRLGLAISVGLSSITFRADKSRNTIVQEYALPDFSRNRHGYIRQPDNPPIDGEQILYMGNERFSIPEVLFCPDHIGKPYLSRNTCL
jgi:hypothetical protein